MLISKIIQLVYFKGLYHLHPYSIIHYYNSLYICKYLMHIYNSKSISLIIQDSFKDLLITKIRVDVRSIIRLGYTYL